MTPFYLFISKNCAMIDVCCTTVHLAESGIGHRACAVGPNASSRMGSAGTLCLALEGSPVLVSARCVAPHILANRKAGTANSWQTTNHNAHNTPAYIT